jgi:hypothetical protein
MSAASQDMDRAAATHSEVSGNDVNEGMNGNDSEVDRERFILDADPRDLKLVFRPEKEYGKQQTTAAQAAAVVPKQEATFTRFLDLAPELRIKIYEAYLKAYNHNRKWSTSRTGNRVPKWPEDCPHNEPEPSLLLVNHKIRNEAMPV